jgi:hypothetical protein
MPLSAWNNAHQKRGGKGVVTYVDLPKLHPLYIGILRSCTTRESESDAMVPPEELAKRLEKECKTEYTRNDPDGRLCYVVHVAARDDKSGIFTADILRVLFPFVDTPSGPLFSPTVHPASRSAFSHDITDSAELFDRIKAARAASDAADDRILAIDLPPSSARGRIGAEKALHAAKTTIGACRTKGRFATHRNARGMFMRACALAENTRDEHLAGFVSVAKDIMGIK